MLAACARIACMWLKCSAGVLLRVCACRGGKGGVLTHSAQPHLEERQAGAPYDHLLGLDQRQHRVQGDRSSHSAPLAPRVVPDSVRISTSGGGAACFQPELPGRPAVSQIRLIAPAVIGAAGEHVRGRKRVINVASNVLHVPGKRVGRARAKTCQPSHACLFPVFQSLK